MTTSRLGQLWGAIAGVGIIALVLATGFVLVKVYDLSSEIRATQQAGSPAVKAAIDAAESADAGTDYIKDCVEAGGECYKDNQRRSADAIASLNQVAILASGCAAGFAELPPDRRVAETQQCVITRLSIQVARDR